eukprot:scaffold18862_cov129-Skeletonema_dohrnii-CCMP3373.AAC.4
MSAFASWPHKATTGATVDKTPIISNKKRLTEPMKMKRSGPHVTSNRSFTSSTTASLSSMSTTTASSQGSPLPRTSSASFFVSKSKTLQMSFPSPTSVADTRDRSPPSIRRTRTSRNASKTTTNRFQDFFIVKACRCAGTDLGDVYEEEDEFFTSEDDDSYLDVYEPSLASESYIDSLGTLSIASSQSTLLNKVVPARRASLSSASRSNSLIDSADSDSNSLLYSTMSGNSLLYSRDDESDDDSIISRDLPVCAEIIKPCPIVDKYYKVCYHHRKKLLTEGIQLLRSEHDSARESSSGKTPGLLFLKLGQNEEDHHLVWEDTETKKSLLFSIFEIMTIKRVNSDDTKGGSNVNHNEMSSRSFCMTLKDGTLLFFEAVDETQNNRIRKVLKGIVAWYTRQMVLGDQEKLVQILQNKNTPLSEECLSSLTDKFVANCFDTKDGISYRV